MAISDNELLAVAIVTWVGGVSSIVGSWTLVFIILNQQKYRTDGYHRLLLGLSLMDLFLSIGWMMGPFALPSDTSERFTALGSIGTCSAAGFLLQMGSTTLVYNAMLCIYFVFVICYGVAPSKMVVFETYMHGFSLAYGVSTAIVGLAFQTYNETAVGPLCWVASSPIDCSREDVECVRGKNALWLAYIFGAVPMLSLPIIVASNLMIFCKVRATERQGHRHNVSRRGLTSRDSRTFRVQRTRQVATQAFLYVLVFLNCTIWAIVLRTLDGWEVANRESESTFLVLILLAHALSPAQGFLNLLVYIRPRYVRLRHRYSCITRFEALRLALWSEPIPGRKASSTVSSGPMLADQAAAAATRLEDGRKNSGVFDGPVGRRISIGGIILLEENYDEQRRPPPRVEQEPRDVSGEVKPIRVI